MKKYILILLTVLSLNTYAQEAEPPVDELPKEGSKAAEKLDALKTAYITKELDLNSEEAQKFWPVYNEFEKELKTIRKENKDDIVVFEEKKVAILKTYKEKFKKVLGDDVRVQKCFKAAPKFYKMVRDHFIKKRRGNAPDGKSPQNQEGPSSDPKFDGGQGGNGTPKFGGTGKPKIGGGKPPRRP